MTTKPTPQPDPLEPMIAPPPVEEPGTGEPAPEGDPA